MTTATAVRPAAADPGYRNFALVHPRVNIGGVLRELAQNEPAWGMSTRRQDTVACQRDTESIVLRIGWINAEHPVLRDSPLVEDTPAAALFPATLAGLRATADALGGELSRVLFARLRPQGQVYKHIDRGEYYACRRRFHLVLHSPQGSPMRSGHERVVMREAELWEFNNKLPHEAFNPSDTPRTHLIFDLRMRTPT